MASPVSPFLSLSLVKVEMPEPPPTPRSKAKLSVPVDSLQSMALKEDVEPKNLLGKRKEEEIPERAMPPLKRAKVDPQKKPEPEYFTFKTSEIRLHNSNFHLGDFDGFLKSLGSVREDLELIQDVLARNQAPVLSYLEQKDNVELTLFFTDGFQDFSKQIVSIKKHMYRAFIYCSLKDGREIPSCSHEKRFKRFDILLQLFISDIKEAERYLRRFFHTDRPAKSRLSDGNIALWKAFLPKWDGFANDHWDFSKNFFNYFKRNDADSIGD